MTTGAPAADAEGRGGGAPEEPRGFVGRGGWHIVAFLAALALILALSLDWYTTEQGEEFRRVEDAAGQSRQVDPNLDEDAAHAAEGQEATAWQADAFVDRLILAACLAAFAAAVAGAFMRSAGRRPEPPWNPSAIATVAGLAGTLLILYRIFQPPGLNEVAIVKPGAPLGLVSVGLLTIGARLATLAEREERAEARGERPAGAGLDEDLGGPEAEPAAGRGLGRRGRDRGERRPRRRRDRPVEPGAVAGSAEAATPGAEPASVDAIDFDFPAPPPPDPAHREDAPPAGEPPPLPPAPPSAPPEPEVGFGDQSAPPDRPPPQPLWQPTPEPPPVADHFGGAPIDARPVGAPNPEEAPDWAPADDFPVEDEPVENEPVEEPPVADPPVDAPDDSAPPAGAPGDPRGG